MLRVLVAPSYFHHLGGTRSGPWLLCDIIMLGLNLGVAMIFVTGDTHIPYDISKLSTKNFPLQKTMTKNDCVIICGDFGAVWENSNSDLYWLAWLERKNFTTLFVDGNHENFDLLNAYALENFEGGKAHFINKSVIHLMRGQVYNLEGYKFFTMGGGSSVDKHIRIQGRSWWPAEMPTAEEYQEAERNLNDHNYEVDFIISHTAGSTFANQLGSRAEESELNNFLEQLRQKVSYKKWFFGHFHDDLDLSDRDFLVYRRIIQIV